MPKSWMPGPDNVSCCILHKVAVGCRNHTSVCFTSFTENLHSSDSSNKSIPFNERDSDVVMNVMPVAKSGKRDHVLAVKHDVSVEPRQEQARRNGGDL